MTSATSPGRARHTLRLPLALAALLAFAAHPAAAQNGGGDGRIEAEGPIEALGAASITVDGHTFDVTPMTRITDDDDHPLPFDSLAVGLEVEVEGVTRPDGSLLALEIEVEDDNGGGGGGHHEGIEAEGLVTARTDSSLAVGGLTFAVTAATRVTDDDRRPISYDSIAVGLRVEVRGAMAPGGALVALLIHLEDGDDDGPGGGHGGDHGRVRAEGPIAFVSADSIRVRNRTFVLTAETRVVGEDHRPIPVDSLAVGQRVEVFGVYTPGRVLVARLIEIEDNDEGEVELRGAIEALTAASLTVSGTEFAVDARTVVLGDNRLPVPFATLVLGQVVEVHGRTNAAGVLLATRIKVEDNNTYEQEIGVRAALDATGDSVAVVLGRPFLVRPFTRILGPGRTPIALADLPVGGLVEVHARRDADGQLVAFRIHTEDGDPATISLRATVTAVSADSVGVLGVAFAAGTAVVVNRDGTPATLADVLVGQGVRLTGVRGADGGFTATRIEIRRSAQAMGRVATTQTGRLGLAGVAVTYTAETLFVTEAGAAVPASSVAAGASVLAFGTTTQAGLLDATRVVVLDAATTVAADGSAPGARLAIERVFPNPTTGSAVVRYAVATAAAVRLTVVDALGRTVLTAVDGQAAAGTHEARLDAAMLPAGLYVVRLSVDGRAAGARTLTVVR